MNDAADSPPVRRFVDPELPERFVFVNLEVHGDARNAALFGPFCRGDVIHESDGAIVFYEDGSSPLRFGVTRQVGDVLDLHPDGSVRVVPVDDEPQ